MNGYSVPQSPLGNQTWSSSLPGWGDSSSTNASTMYGAHSNPPGLGGRRNVNLDSYNSMSSTTIPAPPPGVSTEIRLPSNTIQSSTAADFFGNFLREAQARGSSTMSSSSSSMPPGGNSLLNPSNSTPANVGFQDPAIVGLRVGNASATATTGFNTGHLAQQQQQQQQLQNNSGKGRLRVFETVVGESDRSHQEWNMNSSSSTNFSTEGLRRGFNGKEIFFPSFSMCMCFELKFLHL